MNAYVIIRIANYKYTMTPALAVKAIKIVGSEERAQKDVERLRKQHGSRGYAYFYQAVQADLTPEK